MTKTMIYRYLGTNGIIESPVHLENIYSAQLYRLTAEEGKVLTDGKDIKRSVLISVEDLDKWKEIDDGQ